MLSGPMPHLLSQFLAGTLTTTAIAIGNCISACLVIVLTAGNTANLQIVDGGVISHTDTSKQA